MRRLLSLLTLFSVGCLLAGCTTSKTGASNPLRDMVGSFATAHQFDRATQAFRSGDDADLADAGAKINQLNTEPVARSFTASVAAMLAVEAIQTENTARTSLQPGKAQLMALSDKKYRAALHLLPQDTPETNLNPEILNALGYFLADRGQSHADFERAAALTRASFKNWPMQAAVVGPKPEVQRALGPQDSYAWALFRLGRYQEARAQEEAALKTARTLDPGQITADVPFHMAEIYQTLGQTVKAREEYKAALKLAPDRELKEKIEATLERLEKVRQVKISSRHATL